jgi:glutathione synthase/RimK-type ligase-like ATP-grasp enzyme
MGMTVALVTAREARTLDEDLPPLVAALQARGVRVDVPCWDDPDIDWTGYRAAVLRSTWDYAERVDEFLAWAGRVAGETRLFNSPEILRWNTDKHYLLDLARAGVPVVATRFVEPVQVAQDALARFLAGGSDALSAGHCGHFDEFVVKPAIGAGSRDAARYHRDDVARAIAHVDCLLAARRSVMLQPYLSSVDEAGETALVHVEGRFSHAIRKGPLLHPGAELVAGLFAPETIDARRPGADERAVATDACAAIAGGPPLYARVDLVRDDAGRPVVLELELAEPSLFFAFGPGSAERFAAAILERVSGEL